MIILSTNIGLLLSLVYLPVLHSFRLIKSFNNIKLYQTQLNNNNNENLNNNPPIIINSDKYIKPPIKSDFPAPPAGQGEWAEWDNEAYIDEVYEGDDHEEDDEGATIIPQDLLTIDDKSINSFLIAFKAAPIIDKTDKLNIPVVVRQEQNWEGWSEEPPYFDEDDSAVTDEDLNSWRTETNIDKVSYSGSSNLFPDRATLSGYNDEIYKYSHDVHAPLSTGSPPVPPPIASSVPFKPPITHTTHVSTPPLPTLTTTTSTTTIPLQPLAATPATPLQSTSTGTSNTDLNQYLINKLNQYENKDILSEILNNQETRISGSINRYSSQVQSDISNIKDNIIQIKMLLYVVILFNICVVLLNNR